MWYAGLAGVDAPELPDGTTDRAVALACALRFRPSDPADGGSEFKTHDDTGDFLEFLVDGEAGTRRSRRLALCLACDRIPAGTQKRDLLGVAEWMFRRLNGS